MLIRHTAEAGTFLTERVRGNWDAGCVIELNIQVPHASSAGPAPRLGHP